MTNRHPFAHYCHARARIRKKAIFNLKMAFSTKRFAVWTGLEPATSAVTGRHSNQLNYQTVCRGGSAFDSRFPLWCCKGRARKSACANKRPIFLKNRRDRGACALFFKVKNFGKAGCWVWVYLCGPAGGVGPTPLAAPNCRLKLKNRKFPLHYVA